MVVLLDVILGIDFEHLPKYNYCTGKTGPEIFRFGCVVTAQSTGSPGDNSKWVPPDSISNSEVKPLSADDSVGSPHVKVGHRRGIIKSERPPVFGWPFCFLGYWICPTCTIEGIRRNRQTRVRRLVEPVRGV